MNTMATALLQAVLTGVATFALWRLWRRFVSTAAGDDAFTLIVAAGFAGRALLAQALFWISWLRLPILRSLQLGDGFWFFAHDSVVYLQNANGVLQGGVAALTLWPTYPSHTFVEVLAIFVAAFGSVASTAILLNCAAYLAACLLLLRIGSPARLPRLIALLAISFGPAAVLWSLQPLKDALFLLLVVALVAACSAWQARWRGQRSPAIGPAAGMLVVLYALAGLRWYFAVIVWAVSALFLFLVALSAQRRARAMLGGAVLFAILALSVRLGGAGDMVPFMAYVGRAMRPHALLDAPITPFVQYFAEVRRGFETNRGATTIVAGRAVEAKPPGSSPTSPIPLPPQSTRARLMTGAAVTFLPRALGGWLGLIDIQGGRGLWIFVELDTIAFDAVLLFAIGFLAFALLRRRVRITPLFVLVILVFAVTAVPMVYSVSNFGTLFRLRQMLYVLIAVLPLTIDRWLGIGIRSQPTGC